MKKILFTFGGLPHYVVSQLNRLNELGDFEIIAVVPTGQSKTIGAGVKRDTKNYRFKVIFTEEYTAYYRKPFFKNLNSILKEERPDIVVTIWPYILGFIFYPSLIISKWKLKYKLVFKEIPFLVPKYKEAYFYYKNTPDYNESLIPERKSGILFYLKVFFITKIRKLYYSYIDATVNYTDEAKDIISTYGLSKEKIFVTYNSNDTEPFYKAIEEIKLEEPLLKPSNKRLIHIGRLVAWKKVDLLIHAFKKLIQQHPDAELLIIGDGPELIKLKELAKTLNIEKQTIFLGGIYDFKLLAKYTSESTIYVLAGMGGLSINEAMIFGKPVICSVCDGTEKKLVREGYNGLYFKEDDAVDLAEKMDYLFTHPEIIKNMGENSERIIREEVNINTVIEAYKKAFLTL